MICTQCGTQSPEGSNFCLNCGQELVAQAAQANPPGGRWSTTDHDDLSELEDALNKEIVESGGSDRAKARDRRRTMGLLLYCALLIGSVTLMQPLVGATLAFSGSNSVLAALYFAPVLPLLLFLGWLLQVSMKRAETWDKDRASARNIHNTKNAINGVIGLLRGYVKSKRCYEASMLVVIAGVNLLLIWIINIAIHGVSGIRSPLPLVSAITIISIVIFAIGRQGYKVGRTYKPAMLIGIALSDAYFTKYTGADQHFMKKRDKIKALVISIGHENWKWF